ncbi:hypothetical protein [Streptacidiphilus cavernicola]|uniref:Uncharacterized protein n=1 Tax=Streptacidiphilus cavernicola TaxID=3342716 RepID=A0ABV6VYC9_9ACTN
MLTIAPAVADEVFAKAAKCGWTLTNLGYRAQVSASDGYFYWLTLDESGRYLACIDGAEGWGGSENVHRVHATQEQHRALWTAAAGR